MSAVLIGGLFGLAVGFIGFIVCQRVASRVARDASLADRERVAGTWRMMGYALLVMDTLIGSVAGPFVLSAEGM